MITAHQWKKSVMPLLDDPSEWGWRNKLTYRRPVDWVLLGVTADGSGWSRDQVYVWELHMPLFVPIDHVWLTHGDRVPDGVTTVGLDDEPKFASTIQQAIDKVRSQDEALRSIAESSGEESAYALLVLGRADLAERRLAEPYFPDDDRSFVAEKRQRRSEVAQVLRSEGPDAATGVLRRWRDITAANLKLS